MTVSRYPHKVLRTIDPRLRKSIPTGGRLFYDVMDVETGARLGHRLAQFLQRPRWLQIGYDPVAGVVPDPLDDMVDDNRVGEQPSRDGAGTCAPG